MFYFYTTRLRGFEDALGLSERNGGKEKYEIWDGIGMGGV
jgi:hypothetical protein